MAAQNGLLKTILAVILACIVTCVLGFIVFNFIGYIMGAITLEAGDDLHPANLRFHDHRIDRWSHIDLA